MIPPPNLERLVHAMAHIAVTHGPHLASDGWRKGREIYYEWKELRQAQQERAMGEHLSSRYPSIEKAAEELRRRNPKLTKEQAIAKATLDDVTNTQPQSTKDLEADLSRVKVSRPYGPINSDDLSDSSLPFPDARLWPPRPPE
jgi:hypothetical protein